MKKVFLLAIACCISLMLVLGMSLAGCKSTTAAETTTVAETTVAGTTAAETTVAGTTAAETTAELKKGPFKLAWVPKGLGESYFISCFGGAKEAAAEYGDEIFEVGTNDWSVEGQIAIIESLIQQKVDVIGLAGSDLDALAPVCQKALEAGIHVMAWDAPVSFKARETFVNQLSFEDAGRTFAQYMGEAINYEGEIAIVSATPQAPNQRKHVNWVYEELKDPKYAKMKIVDVVFSDDQMEKAYNKTIGLIKAYPNLKGIIVPTGIIPAVCTAVMDQNMVGKIYVTGTGLPSTMVQAVKAGVSKKFLIWNTTDLGYLAATAMHYLAEGTVTKDPDTGLWISTAPFSGKEGSSFTIKREMSGWKDKTPTVTIGEDGDPFILLGPRLEITPENIDEWAKLL